MRTTARLLLLTLALAPAARADAPPARALVRIAVDDPRAARVDWERLGLDVVGLDPHHGTVDVLAPPDALDALLERDGLRIHGLEARDADRKLRDLRQYRRPAQVKQVLDQIVQAASHLATLEDLTPEGLFEGQHVYSLRLSSTRGPADKPSVLFTCQIHAGESSTTEVCLDIAQVLSSGYGTDGLVTRWLDEMAVYVVPMVNPDGVEHAMNVGEHWRMNRDPKCPVDLNRNFGASWDACEGATKVCGGADDYRGPEAYSEPETRALRALLLRVKPRYHVDYHEFGEDIAYPGGCGTVGRDAELAALGEGLKAVLEDDDGVKGRYSVGPLYSTVYPVAGSLMEESYEACGTLSFLFEIGREFAPPPSAGIVERQRAGWQFLLTAVEQCTPGVPCKVSADRVVGDQGCGCSATGPASLPLLALALGAMLRRRRGRSG